MWSGLLALKCKLRGKEELDEMMPWSCGTLNSSPNSSTPCSLQDTGRAVLLCSATLRLSRLERRMNEGRKSGEKYRGTNDNLCNWCTVFWLYIWPLEAYCIDYLFGGGFTVLCENHFSSYYGKVICLPWYSILYFGTCAAKFCQSESACFPASALAERPSRRGQWWQALDCPWYSKRHCPSFAPVWLGRPTLSTPSRTEEYLHVPMLLQSPVFLTLNVCHTLSMKVSVKRQCYGTCFSLGFRVMAGGSSRYVAAWVSCWKWNWTSASRPELLWITSFSVFSGYLFSLYLHKHRWMWSYKSEDWYEHTKWFTAISLPLTCLWSCHRVMVRTQSIQVWLRKSSGSLPAFVAPSYRWEKESWGNHIWKL